MPQPTPATSLVTVGHIGIISPTSTSHVGDWSKTFAIHVEDQNPSVVSHDVCTSLVIASYTAHSSPTSASHVGYFLLVSANHAGRNSPAIVNDVGGIHTIENPRRVRRKPKFLCRICEGNHLNHLCPATAPIPKAWSFLGGPLGSDSSLSSQPSLVDTTVMLMKYSDDTPLPLGVDASLDFFVSHPVQPTVVLMPSSIDTTPIFGGDSSLNIFVSHPIQPMVE
jgi:hypothetical protein